MAVSDTYVKNEAALKKYAGEDVDMFTGKTIKVVDIFGFKVYYRGEINSAGSYLAGVYVEYIKKRWPGRFFQTAYEIGCGPGFMGFALLASGLCSHLVLSDIDPSCEEVIRLTINENNLKDSVEFYVSNSLDNIPKILKFDIVVSNPPWSYEIPEEVGSSISWITKTHRYDVDYAFVASFYRSIKEYLTLGAPILWATGMPLEKKFFRIPGATVYERPEPPIIRLTKYVIDGGLFLREVCHPDNTLWSFWLLVSENPRVSLEDAYII